jgi:polygalacturonase
MTSPLTLAAACPGLRLDVRSFGARGDGVTDDRAAIQSAIDQAAAAKDGTCAVIPAGIYLSGGLLLKPAMTLYISLGAMLRASTNGTSYLHQIESESQASAAGVPLVVPALVGARGAHNARVVGEGVLDGQCPQYITGLGSTNNGTGWLPQQLTFRRLSIPGHPSARINVLDVSHSENVTVAGVTLTDSHGWTSRFVNCTNVLLTRVRVYGDWRMPNNDGIDPVSCNNVTIESCDINTADDAISPKSGISLSNGTKLAMPLRGLTIRDTRIRSRSFAIKFGTETYGDISDIVVDRVHIYDSHQGIGLDLRRPGSLTRARFTNMCVRTGLERGALLPRPDLLH